MEASFGIAIHSAKEGGQKRHKQPPQGPMTTIDYDNGNNGKAGGSGVGHIVTATRSKKHQAWPPTDHFKRLLEEAYSNHTYPISHKLKDCIMMKSFMISGSLT
jgi:hypothetical protein